MKAEGLDVVSFAAGEPDFNTPLSVCQSASQALEQGLTKYAPSRGLPILVEAIIRKLGRENKLQASGDNIVVSCGAKHSLYNAFMTLLDPGDEVILIAPYWMTYADQIVLAGGVPVIVQTTADTGFTPHSDQIKAALTAKTKAIVINSPCNPTGSALSRQQLKDIAAIALRHNLWIISDEIYERLTYDHPHTSIASLSKEVAERTVSIFGCSKSYSMTGWRIGFSVAPKQVSDAMANLQDQVTSNATTFAQAGAATALDLPDAEVESMRSEFETRRNLGLELLRAIPGLRISQPKGAFYFFVDCSAYLQGSVKTDLDLAELLLEKAHVATVPGSVFVGPGHLRLSYAASREDIQKGVMRLAQVLPTIA
ncbi:MAG: pyridoxal phosphate-dependent aminotransferase [Fimbriimonadaceae bacterium]|nr:pyridoxal phosphate-dependent aminotransferase [Fimbriimonadaceae bacterium]